MVSREKPAGVAVTGWLCAVAGVLTVIAGVTFGMAGVLARALEQQGTDLLAQARAAMDPLSRTLLDHFGTVAAILVVTGLGSLIIGVQFARLRPAARLGMEILGWLVLAGTVALQAAASVWTWKHGLPDGTVSWLSHPVTSWALSLLQAAVCVALIRFVRRPEVRRAFAASLAEGR